MLVSGPVLVTAGLHTPMMSEHEHVNEDLKERLVAYLQALPAGSEVVFSDDSLLFAPDVHHGYVDAFVPEVCEAVGLNWCWTIVGADKDDDGDDRSVLVVEYDLDLWAVKEPGRGHVESAAFAVPHGHEPDPTAHATLEAVAAAGLGRSVERIPAWSSARLETALCGWAADHAGRPDLRFRFDQTIGHSPMMLELLEYVDEERGEGTPWREVAAELGLPPRPLPDEEACRCCHSESRPRE